MQGRPSSLRSLKRVISRQTALRSAMENRGGVTLDRTSDRYTGSRDTGVVLMSPNVDVVQELHHEAEAIMGEAIIEKREKVPDSI